MFAFSQKQINWTLTADLNDSLSKSQKPIMIKNETDWCGYCKMMDLKVFAHKKVIQLIKDDYYFIPIIYV